MFYAHIAAPRTSSHMGRCFLPSCITPPPLTILPSRNHLLRILLASNRSQGVLPVCNHLLKIPLVYNRSQRAQVAQVALPTHLPLSRAPKVFSRTPGTPSMSTRLQQHLQTHNPFPGNTIQISSGICLGRSVRRLGPSFLLMLQPSLC